MSAFSFGPTACYCHDLSHGPRTPEVARLAYVKATAQDKRASLLASRVSAILDAHPAALGVLIDSGFEPLANPVARRTLAHTVNLSQALRIRGLSAEAEESLINRLLQLGVADATA